VTKTSLELDSSIGRLWGTFRSRADGADIRLSTKTVLDILGEDRSSPLQQKT
jgi:hypothetical protein